MNFPRTFAALPAALLLTALTLTGCSTSAVHKAEGVAGTVIQAAKSAASPSAPSSPAAGDAAAGSAGTVKSLHSPDQVAVDVTLSPGQCKVRTIDAAAGLYLPDPACTPGAVDPAVTQANIGSTICKSGYTATVRAPSSDTAKTKSSSLAQYGQERDRTTEYDHLISLQLGGTNAVSNLWPEQNRANAPGTTNPKDAVETKLNKAVCSHRVPLAAAQKAIATNWVTAAKDLGL